MSNALHRGYDMSLFAALSCGEQTMSQYHRQLPAIIVTIIAESAGELGLGHGSTKSDSLSHTRGASSEKSLPPGRDRTQGVLVQESQPAGMPAAEASAYSTTHLGNISIADISKACGRTFEPPPSPQPNKFASMHMHANSPYRSMHMHTHTHTHTHRHKHIHTHGHV